MKDEIKRRFKAGLSVPVYKKAQGVKFTLRLYTRVHLYRWGFGVFQILVQLGLFRVL